MRFLSRRLAKLILPALALVWITGAYAGHRIGDKATDFSLEPAAGGEAVSLSQFKGKPVLVVFWATWCPPCRREMPVLKKLHEKYGPMGLEIVSVSIPYRQTRESVVKFQEKYDLPFSVLWDSENAASRHYPIRRHISFSGQHLPGRARTRAPTKQCPRLQSQLSRPLPLRSTAGSPPAAPQLSPRQWFRSLSAAPAQCRLASSTLSPPWPPSAVQF